MLWDVETGNHVCSLNGLRDAVTFIAFSVDGRLLATESGAGWNCFLGYRDGHEAAKRGGIR